MDFERSVCGSRGAPTGRGPGSDGTGSCARRGDASQLPHIGDSERQRSRTAVIRESGLETRSGVLSVLLIVVIVEGASRGPERGADDGLSSNTKQRVPPLRSATVGMTKFEMLRCGRDDKV